VQPRAIGNQVIVEITPRISSINQQEFIDFKELSTMLTLNLGKGLDIGVKIQNKDEISRKIQSSQSVSNTLKRRLLINSGLSIYDL
jgi:hypothetical protein